MKQVIQRERMMSATEMSEGSSPVVRTIVVEDNEATLERYVSLLKNENGIDCLGGYATAEKMLDRIEDDLPDVILMDI